MKKKKQLGIFLHSKHARPVNKKTCPFISHMKMQIITIMINSFIMIRLAEFKKYAFYFYAFTFKGRLAERERESERVRASFYLLIYFQIPTTAGARPAQIQRQEPKYLGHHLLPRRHINRRLDQKHGGVGT